MQISYILEVQHVKNQEDLPIKGRWHIEGTFSLFSVALIHQRAYSKLFNTVYTRIRSYNPKAA